MMKQKGLLSGNLNQIQDLLLISVLSRNEEKETDARMETFEQQMAIGNPTMYQSWLENKKIQEQENNYTDENTGEIRQIEWRAPQSAQEAREIADEFAEMEKLLKSTGINSQPTKPVDIGTDSYQSYGLLTDEDIQLLKDTE